MKTALITGASQGIGAAIAYELNNNNRIGISFSHISNANLGDKNPGVEILSFSYHIPY